MCTETGSKAKLLYILKILMTETDEDHIITMEDIIKRLGDMGIRAERKSVYRDLKLLFDFGYDISLFEENHKGYYLRSREFETVELKLLTDAVASARFILSKKTDLLLKKIKCLTSRHQAKLLDRSVYYDPLIKSSNEEVFFNIEVILTAINKNIKVSFLYNDYNLDMKLKPRRGGERYVISPYAIVWVNDFYYLIGNFDGYDDLSHYRVDRISNITDVKEHRKPIEKVNECENGLGIGEYVKKAIYMFPGEEERVELLCKSFIMNIIIDRFGKDALIIKDNEEYIRVLISVFIGDGFFHWLLQFGEHCEVLSPRRIREEMKRRVTILARNYNVIGDEV